MNFQDLILVLIENSHSPQIQKLLCFFSESRVKLYRRKVQDQRYYSSYVSSCMGACHTAWNLSCTASNQQVYSALSKHPFSETYRLHYLLKENFKLGLSDSLPPAHSHPLHHPRISSELLIPSQLPAPLQHILHHQINLFCFQVTHTSLSSNLLNVTEHFLEKTYQKKFSKPYDFFFNTDCYINNLLFCDKVRFLNKNVSSFEIYNIY